MARSEGDSGLLGIRQLAARHLKLRPPPQQPPLRPDDTVPLALSYTPATMFAAGHPTFDAEARRRTRWTRVLLVLVLIVGASGGALLYNLRVAQPADSAAARKSKSAIVRRPQIVQLPVPDDSAVTAPMEPPVARAASAPVEKLTATTKAAADRDDFAEVGTRSTEPAGPAPEPAEVVAEQQAEPPAPEAEPPPVAPAGSADPLAGLMATAVSGKPQAKVRVESEVDRQLAGIHDDRSGEATVEQKKDEQAPSRVALSRTDIQNIMRSVQEKVGACRERPGDSGVANLTVTVSPEGTVTALSLTGKYAGKATGACIEKFVKASHFPPSTGLRFPFQLLVR